MSVKAGAGERMVTLDVSLLGRNYKVACKEHERADLLAAVEFLDGRMREIRDAGKNLGADRIAVMAALNIANDLLRERKAPPASAAVSARARAPIAADASVDVDAAAARRRIQSMQAAIDQALAGQEKLL